jgi:hypothetical protein
MHLPALVSIGALIGFVFVMHAWIRKKANFLALFFILASLLIGIWFVLLQESAKASWRYALPIVPYLYVFAAYGWWHFAKLVSFHRKMFAFALCGILSGCFCATVLSSYPQYFFFRSTVSGGLAYQARVGAGLPNFVVPEVLNAILAKARGYYGPHPFLVDLPGDAEIYRLALSMSAPDMIEKIGFGYFPAPERSMELWYTFLPPRKGAVKHDLCMEYSLKGEPLVALYD